MTCWRCFARLLAAAAFAAAIALIFCVGIPMVQLAWAGRYGFAY